MTTCPRLHRVRLYSFQTNPSGGEVRRLIQGGSVQLNGEKLADPKATPEWKESDVLKLDKNRQVRLALA